VLTSEKILEEYPVRVEVRAGCRQSEKGEKRIEARLAMCGKILKKSIAW
jgi:hypothetical protein